MEYCSLKSFFGKSAMSEASERSAEQPTRIDEIATQWSLLRLAHQASLSVAGPARNVLVLRYSRAIRGYVGAMVKEVEDADEIAQEVVVRLLQGSFARANPERGRFRDMLKVAVRNVVLTYWTKKKRRASVDVDVAQLPGEGTETQIEQEWTAAWQRSILDMTWAAMEDYARAHPQSVSWIILRLRADHADDDLTQLAARFAQQTGKSLRPAALRQQLRRARLRFAELLIEEVAKSLDDPTPERVEEELIETGLMPYVQDFLPADWRTKGELREVP
jgi:DNA-directed RNA polymerase specialized sigma24 family protein